LQERKAKMADEFYH